MFCTARPRRLLPDEAPLDPRAQGWRRDLVGRMAEARACGESERRRLRPAPPGYLPYGGGFGRPMCEQRGRERWRGSRVVVDRPGESSPTPGQIGSSSSPAPDIIAASKPRTPASPFRARRRGLCARSRAVLGVGSRCPPPSESIARRAPRGLAPKALSASRAPEDDAEHVRKSPLTRARPRVPAKTRLTYLQRRARVSEPPPKATGARARDIGDDVDRLEPLRRRRRPRAGQT